MHYKVIINIVVYFSFSGELPMYREYFRDKSIWSLKTEQDGTWVVDSFLSATPETIVVSLNDVTLPETILKHRPVTVGVSSLVLPFRACR